MKILLIHQNFPGQYKHLAPALAAQGHQVVALTCKVKEAQTWQGVRIIPYEIKGASTKGIHPWLADFETKILRGTSCYRGALGLKEQGFEPDVICAHHGWGESMFLKDVWPKARLGLYCELYHLTTHPFVDFDPEFPSQNPAGDKLRIRMKNLNNRLHEEVMDAGISPTRFQAATFPDHWQDRLTVAHDGIDTNLVRPNPGARLEIENGPTLTRDDEVITFINRNLEPYRGYHVFMRALPDLLKRRKNAHVVMLGGDSTSYGSKPPQGKTWKQIFIDEVRGRIPTPHWNRVHFLGRVPYDRFLAMMQVSRVHVYLTYPFVLSWSLLEAMSAEAAIVASDTAPVREVMTEGETGLMVDFFDRAALVDRIDALLDDPDTRARLGANARALVREQYDLHSVCLPRHLDWVRHLGDLPARPPRD
ncbi:MULTISPECIES: glycosyltransferase [Mameliella]|uniref:Glycosyl transferase n=1 Tax=Mameliella alba TaxID=561184 RepID=A0A0B3SDL7_9RHOB|nr:MULTISPECIES: glycosyltransferase [Mameliella]MCR9272282.1 glycosyltransferase [Paracoccaceae bacterium]KHQ54826.1 Glycosyl transferase [Mameliella alba]OWV48634.1 glycosyl transferase [Mameliella alba]OWV61717.1 glycosyl transferase [Mameliella alba]PTR39188.1 glycosyltransferase involved in cell wall biosynthesis [Mameliella alba]